MLTSLITRGASPLGLPHPLSREPLRRLAPFAWAHSRARSPAFEPTSSEQDSPALVSFPTIYGAPLILDETQPGPSSSRRTGAPPIATELRSRKPNQAGPVPLPHTGMPVR